MPRPIRSLAAAAAVLLLAACDPRAAPPAGAGAPVDSAAGEVGFELAGPSEAALIVPVFINGEGPFDFVIDTGATLTCVDQRLSARLGLDRQRGRTGVSATVGGVGSVQIVQTDSIRVGEARAAGLRVCVVDLAPARGVGVEAQGLLGLNFLRTFRVTFDFARNTVRFAPPQ